MTLREILSEAMVYAGTPIPDRKFLDYYNRAIHDLALKFDTAKKVADQSISVTDVSQEFTLTSGMLKLQRVLDSDSNYFKFFKVYNNTTIIFGYTGTYEIQGLFEHTRAATMNDTVTINPAYHMAIAKYIAAKVNSGKSAEFMAEYIVDSAAANNSIRKVNNPNRTARARLWR